MEEQLQRKVVIIGAGASGLYTACCLAQKGHNDVVLLEAQDSAGGRIRTIPYNSGWLELGAQWIHGRGENPLWKFVQDKKIPTAPEANRDGEGIFVRDDGKLIPEDVLKETKEFLWNVHWECDKFAKQKDPSKIPVSVGHFFQDRFDNWLSEEKSKDSTETKAWRHQLFRWWIKWEECDAGCDDIFQHSCISWGEYVDYETDTSFSDGYCSFINALLDDLNKFNVKILYNHVVKKVDYSCRNNQVIILQCDNGTVFHADHVISTISLGCLKQHHKTLFNPTLPSTLKKAIESVSFGTIDRVNLEFEEIFWDLYNPGFMLMWRDDELIKTQVINRSNWHKHIYGFDAVLDQPNILMGWISGEAARFMESLPDHTIADTLCQQLEKLMRNYKCDPDWVLPKLKNVVVTRWHNNPYTRGVYSYRNHESDLNGIRNKDLSEPLLIDGYPRVLFAGEATDKEHYGTVHGALSAAAREVNRLVHFWKNNFD